MRAIATVAFPIEALDTYTKQLVPSAESTLQGRVAVAPEDLVLLPILMRICTSCWIRRAN